MASGFQTKIRIILGVLGLAVIVAAGALLVRSVNRKAELAPPEGATPGMAEQQPTAPQGERAPDFALANYEGAVVKSGDFTGMPLVINSWAAWCPFCVDELPDFAQVQQEFAGRIVIIAIDRAESLDVARTFTDDLNVTDGLVFLLDPTDSFYRSIGGFSMPETLFVRPDGTIQFHKRGPMQVDEIRQRVVDLINTIDN